MGLVMLIYAAWDIKKTRRKQHEPIRTETKEMPLSQPLRAEYEPIRQMALVQVDEFETFYLPIIEKIKTYEKLTNLPPRDSNFFDLLFKSLRLKRAAIFETDSPETNKVNAPYWTLGLFLAILCRYAVRLLNSTQFRDENKRPVNPILERIEALSGLEIKPHGQIADYAPNTINIHILEKIIPLPVIKMLDENQVYPYVINAITGYYIQRSFPFYRIIETVEEHVYSPDINTANTTFDRTIDHVAALIENNTVIKNTIDSLIFESNRCLYIDRHLLWEMFKTYHVFEQGTMTKMAFEQRLIERLSLQKTSTQFTTARVYGYEAQGSIEQDSVSYIEVNNTIALPYAKLANYLPTKRLRIEQLRLHREVGVESFNEVIKAADNSSQHRNEKEQNTVFNSTPATMTRSEKKKRSQALFEANEMKAENNIKNI